MARKTPVIWWQGLENGTKRVSAVIGSLVVIISAAAAGGTWIINAVDDRITTQTTSLAQDVEDLRKQIKSENEEQEKSLKRLELMTLIQNNPENKAEIEKVAYYYFVVLDGDWYASKIYSDWANANNGDITIVIGVDSN